ncbi:ankyrin repeat domain-containing protein [Diaphorobacter sp.]|uniref:ankyrin repeat domain-containing protein n=1 Tax=Diaphorobacter sp. TaxID=1934310 RepID=UPI0028A63989|nr:ankyrin repeat domain-containing protein [Diaphorobacter sp.]
MKPMNRRQGMGWVAAGALLCTPLARAGAVDDLFTAIIRDNPSTIQSLIQRGVDPNARNADGQPTLIFALQRNSMRAFDALLQARNIRPEQRNKKDESPLMIAAIQGNLDVAKTLIAKGGDVNMTGWTPLHYAASCVTDAAVPMIQLLLEHHAYIDAGSPNGTTPLMMAVRYGTSAAAELLIAEGADPGIRNEKGLSAIEFAQQADRPDMVRAVTQAQRNRRPSQPTRGKW